MAWELWLAFVGAAVLIAVSPGAGAIQSMATGLTHGVRRGYWSILGLEVGLMLQLALVAVGLGAIVTSSIVVFNVIKWVGVAYLLYLAVRQWRTATRDLREQLGTPAEGGRAALVARGFLINATPKDWCSSSRCCRSSWCRPLRCFRSTSRSARRWWSSTWW
jgi:homoserine/homoserine lactone efflux protein